MTYKLPQICVYGPCADAPNHMRYVSAMIPMLLPGKKVGDKNAFVPGSSWMGHAATEEGARKLLVDMWHKQYPPPKADVVEDSLDDLV